MSPFIEEKNEPQYNMKTEHSTVAAFKIGPVKEELKDNSETSEIDCTDSINRSKHISSYTNKSGKAEEQNHNFSCKHSRNIFISLSSIADFQKIVNNKVDQLLQRVVNQKAEITSLKTELAAIKSRNLEKTQEKLSVPITNLVSNTSAQDRIYEELCTAKIAFTTRPDYFSAPSSPLNTALPNRHTLPVDPITAPVSPCVSTASTSKSSATSFATNRSKRRRGRPSNEHADGPDSSCVSTASTSKSSSTSFATNRSKRRRGRPSKAHADGPDPKLMSQMTKNELKVYKDRVSNNEASRISRLKGRERIENEIKEEEALQAINKQLRAKLNRLLHRSHMAETLLGQKSKNHSLTSRFVLNSRS